MEPVPTPRRPNFVAFIGTGAVLGFLVGGYLAWSGVFEKESTLTGANGVPVFPTSSGIGYLGLLGALLLGLLGGVVAVLLDRSGRS